MVSVYWSFQTITTVGFGDISIMTSNEYMIAVFWMFAGVSFYSYTVGSVAGIIAAMDTKAAILSNKLTTLNGYAERIKLPEDTSVRISRFLENDSKDQNSLVEQESLQAELPAVLRLELMTFTHSSMINRITFLRDKNADFLWKVLPLLKPRKVYRGDLLYAQ